MKLRPISLAILALFAFASCRNNSTQPPPVTFSGTWNPSSSGTSEYLVVGQFVNSAVGFAAGSNGVMLKTPDSGSTWNMRSPAPVVTTSAGPGVVYGISFFDAANGFAVGDQRAINQTTDGGMHWTPMDNSLVPTSDLIRSVHFINRNNGFIGTSDAYGAQSGTICRSEDGGQTWKPVFTTDGGIYNIDFNIPGSNGMNGIAQGRWGVNYWTNDGGVTWNPGTTDQPNSLVTRSTFTSATTGFAVGYPLTDTTHGFILRTDDGGHNWHTMKSISPCLDGISCNGNGTITAAGFGGIVLESTDGGATWTQSNVGTSRWIDVRYANEHRAVLFGMSGNIATRDK
jgi:photosystem II stability/assembly factor-like uncharacterized protein